MLIYSIIHLCCFIVMVGFVVQKAESPFIDESDGIYWVANLLPNLVLAPIMVLFFLGRKLHGVYV